MKTQLGVILPLNRTAIFDVPADGELALALELRHPQVYGAILCASPSGGYNPPTGILLTWRITLLGKSSDALEQRRPNPEIEYQWSTLGWRLYDKIILCHNC